MMTFVCQTCGNSCGAAYPCPACGALYYCSSKHLHISRRLGHDAEECRRMQQQLGRAQEVYNFGLQCPTKSAQDVCDWLKRVQCHDCSLLQHCCPVHTMAFSDQLQEAGQQLVQPHSVDSLSSRDTHTEPCYASLPCSGQDWYKAWSPLHAGHIPLWPTATAYHSPKAVAGVLQQEHGTQHKPVQHQQLQESSTAEPGVETPQPTMSTAKLVVPQCWNDYYIIRGIHQESPAALVLHFPLTLWYCLAVLLPSRGRQLPPTGSTLSIAYLGAQVELCMLPAFLELLALLPGYHVSMHMIGPGVPEQLHGRACRSGGGVGAVQGSVTISCWNGCWHDTLQDWQQQDRHWQNTAAQTAGEAWFTASPAAAEDLHLVFAANAGLPAFPSWLPTLQQLLLVSRHRPTCGAAAHGEAEFARSSELTAAQSVLVADQCLGEVPPTTAPKAAASDGGLHGQGSQAQPGIPVLFSDYCEEAAVKSQQMVQALLGQGFDLQALLNPFRQPAPSHHHGTRLPACSNCFLFGWL